MTKINNNHITFYIPKERKSFYDRALKAIAAGPADTSVSRHLNALIDADFKKRRLIDDDGTLNFKTLTILEIPDSLLLEEVKRRGLF